MFLLLLSLACKKDSGPNPVSQIRYELSKVDWSSEMSDCTTDCEEKRRELAEQLVAMVDGESDITTEQVEDSLELAAEYQEMLSELLADITFQSNPIEVVFEYNPPDIIVGNEFEMPGVSGATAKMIWRQSVFLLQSNDPNITADGSPPLPDPLGEAGFYFNSEEEGSKINWYVYADDGASPQSLSIKDVEGFSIKARHDNADGYYYFTVYTMPEDDGKDATDWYRSRIQFVIINDGVVAGEEYTSRYYRYEDLEPGSNFLDFMDPNTQISTVFSDGATSLGEINEEKIMTIAISTSSSNRNNEFLFKNIEMTIDGKPIHFLPMSLKDPPVNQNNFYTIVAPFPYGRDLGTSFYGNTRSNPTSLFSNFAIEVDRTTFSTADGAPLMIGDQLLVEKLHFGTGKDITEPYVRFQPETRQVIVDIGARVSPTDISSLSINFFENQEANSPLLYAEIDSEGQSTKLVFE